MPALEEFESTLKEVVNAKRVSASKMNKLTEIVMKSLDEDTKLVATLYRTHKSLLGPAKISSLYVFDALARAARSFVTKRGITGDINSARGNAATFLLKIEGVLEGLFQDMASLNNPEAKEKAKKVHDIWVKSNTFPSAVLAQLGDILSDVRKENSVNSTPSINPSAANEEPATNTSQPALPPQSGSAEVQAALLALLGQAAQVQSQPSSQIPPNTDSQLRLALLQQLALTAKLTNGSPTPPPGQTPPPTDKQPPPTVTPALDSFSTPSQTRFDHAGDAPYGRNGYPDRGRDRHDYRDERPPPRGGFRGGYRGRGRGRWDDHHSHDRFRHRDRDGDPLPRPRHSRSRSPRRRDTRPHSPPRRPIYDRHGQHQPELPASANTHDTDEFGREYRASSDPRSRSPSVEDTKALASVDTSVDPTPGVGPDYHTPVSDQMPSVAASTSSESTETHTPSGASQQQQPGLDQFDFTTFDATAPSSWEALGNMWKTTYGYPPSQEELMHFMMTGSMAAAGMGGGGLDGPQGQWQKGQWEDHGRGRRGGRGRGNYTGGYGDTEATEPTEPSYAVVLNGGELSDGASTKENVSDEPGEVQDTASRGGRMQRVGDKWMFVRET